MDFLTCQELLPSPNPGLPICCRGNPHAMHTPMADKSTNVSHSGGYPASATFSKASALVPRSLLPAFVHSILERQLNHLDLSAASPS